jgi:beta-galactosidase
MTSVKAKNGVIEVNGRKIPLISGEFHYWRHFPDQWLSILESIKEMGLTIVSTYVPWNFHELKPGEYDFEGRANPRANLKRFIELVKRRRIIFDRSPRPVYLC